MIENLITVVVTAVIPFVVQVLKKIKLGGKLAPWMALAIALIAVSVMKVAGLEADITTIYQGILQSLGIAGVSIAGYDIVKLLTKK